MSKAKKPNSKPIPATSDDGLELARAVYAWKEKTGVPFPSWTQVVEILKGIGRWQDRPGDSGQGGRNGDRR